MLPRRRLPVNSAGPAATFSTRRWIIKSRGESTEPARTRLARRAGIPSTPSGQASGPARPTSPYGIEVRIVCLASVPLPREFRCAVGLGIMGIWSWVSISVAINLVPIDQPSSSVDRATGPPANDHAVWSRPLSAQAIVTTLSRRVRHRRTDCDDQRRLTQVRAHRCDNRQHSGTRAHGL